MRRATTDFRSHRNGRLSPFGVFRERRGCTAGAGIGGCGPMCSRGLCWRWHWVRVDRRVSVEELTTRRSALFAELGPPLRPQALAGRPAKRYRGGDPTAATPNDPCAAVCLGRDGSKTPAAHGIGNSAACLAALRRARSSPIWPRDTPTQFRSTAALVSSKHPRLGYRRYSQTATATKSRARGHSSTTTCR